MDQKQYAKGINFGHPYDCDLMSTRLLSLTVRLLALEAVALVVNPEKTETK